MATKIIGIDIREANGKGAGKGRYAEEITRAMIEVAPQDTHFILFCKEHNPAFPQTERVDQVIIQGSGLRWHRNLRSYLKKKPLDFYFSPTSFIVPSWAPHGQKQAIVVHDMIAFLFKEHHHWFPILVEKLTLGRAIRKSSFITTISQHTWKDLNTVKPVAGDKPVVFAPPAVSEDYYPVERRNMKLPDKYLLAIGTLQPRKNFEGVLRAFKHLAPKHPDLHLCIAGGKGWKDSGIFKEVPEDLKERIHFLGYVTVPELPELYTRAQMLVFPSFYEGFGIPPLEAMACGCPVITSNVSSLPEVVGDAAIMVDPHNLDQLIEAIEELLRSKAQADFRRAGLRRAKHFSWQESAGLILKQIDKALSH